jgi:hypothetical protein
VRGVQADGAADAQGSAALDEPHRPGKWPVSIRCRQPPGQSPEACWWPVPGTARFMGGRSARPFRPVPHVPPRPLFCPW